MKGIGSTICKTDKEFRRGLTAVSMRENTKMEKNMEKESICGQMAATLLAIGMIIKFMDMASIVG